MHSEKLQTLLLVVSFCTANAFVRPSSPETFRRYLIGEWTVNKRYVYKLGGMSGTWSGEASFRMLDVMKSPALVAYNESGQFVPKLNGNTVEERATETRNRLIYDFSSPQAADVFFDTLPDTERFSTNAVVEAAKYLYSLKPQYDGRMSIEQLKESDSEYSGDIEIDAPNAFMTTWVVRGEQDGEIIALYKRVMNDEDL